MKKFRKKPVVIEAIQFDGTHQSGVAIWDWSNQEVKPVASGRTEPGKLDGMLIYTLEGILQAKPGDWIIKGVKGELYPCKPDIFDATYEKVEE